MQDGDRLGWAQWWARSSRGMRLGAVVVILAVIVAAGAIVSLNKNAGVDWENYPSSLRVRIDELTRENDCAGLDRERARARAGSAEQRREAGDDNADVIAYIRKQQQYLGCG